MGTLERTEELSPSQCWDLVRAAPVGRLAVVVDGRPEIFPLNHLVDHGTLVFRTVYGTKLVAALGSPVAYEVDGLSPDASTAWSVVVKGWAREISRLHEVVDTQGLPLFPWHRGPKPRVVRIEPEQVTGRRFTVAVPQETPAGTRSAEE